MTCTLGEDAVRLGDDEEIRCRLTPITYTCKLKTAGEIVEAKDEIAAGRGGGNMLVEALARRVEEFGMMRLVRSQFREPRQGRRLKVVGRNARRRRITGVDERDQGSGIRDQALKNLILLFFRK